MEKVVSTQVTKFLEENSLLPKSQHGFRQMRSTMTAHSNMQQDWINNKEAGLKTGLQHLTHWILTYFAQSWSYIVSQCKLRVLNKYITYFQKVPLAGFKPGSGRIAVFE